MKKCLAICIYLLLITAFLRFDIRLLFDAMQLFLVVFGAALLHLPALGKRQGRFHFDRGLFGQNSLWASIIQTFVLLFMVLSEGQSREEMMVQTAMACRPLLYGFCLWVVFSEDSFDMAAKGKGRDSRKETGLTAEMAEGTGEFIDNSAKKEVQKRIHEEPEGVEKFIDGNANRKAQRQVNHESEGAENFFDGSANTEMPKQVDDGTEEAKNFFGGSANREVQKQIHNESEGAENFFDGSTNREVQKQIHNESEGAENFFDGSTNREMRKQVNDGPEETKADGGKTQKVAKNSGNENTENEAARETPRERLASLGLTRREIEVALLTAASLSNAEIAAELFISETTVKKHLSNIYGKLGISKRGQIGELFIK